MAATLLMITAIADGVNFARGSEIALTEELELLLFLRRILEADADA